MVGKVFFCIDVWEKVWIGEESFVFMLDFGFYFGFINVCLFFMERVLDKGWRFFVKEL